MSGGRLAAHFLVHNWITRREHVPINGLQNRRKIRNDFAQLPSNMIGYM
jgi:hypothetical protein